jgi:DNA-binding winged helix-turn-helix (wHTH) protein
MRNRNIVHDVVERRGAAVAQTAPAAGALALVKPYAAPVLRKACRRPAVQAQTSYGSPDVTELNLRVDGFSVVVRVLPDDVSTRHESGPNATDTRSLLLSAFEKVFEGIRGSGQLAKNSPSMPAPAVLEAGADAEPAAASETMPAQTVLRVGPLELDLLERTARRGDRQIALRPREFRLLRYMMEHSGKLLARAKLLQEVWNYKFVPQTNLVDVHMGRLRRKVDGANEPAMIHSVRGAGFALSANSLTQI